MVNVQHSRQDWAKLAKKRFTTFGIADILWSASSACLSVVIVYLLEVNLAIVRELAAAHISLLMPLPYARVRHVHIYSAVCS